MAYCVSVGYDTGICNTSRGISQNIPLCPRNSYTFPPDHDVLILNTNVYNDSVCWGLGIAGDGTGKENVMTNTGGRKEVRRKGPPESDITIVSKFATSGELPPPCMGKLATDLEDFYTELRTGFTELHTGFTELCTGFTEIRMHFTQIEARTVIRDGEMKVLFETLTESTSNLTTVDETVQTVQTQVLTLNERVTNVEKVRKVEKIVQVTHRNVDALDNRLGQIDKRVLVLMRDMDSKFQHELEKTRNNESDDHIRFQVESLNKTWRRS
jgi:hypothetical protein